MITIGGFSGEMPKTIPRLLPAGAAQIATNCKMVDGSIMPLRHPSDYRQLALGNIMFYKRGSIWFEWNVIVDVAQSSTAQDRIYITGDNEPKIVVNSTVFSLAVAAPVAALTVSTTGTPNAATQANYTYAYTYVTAFDEESEPSPLSASVLRSPGMDVTLPPSSRRRERAITTASASIAPKPARLARQTSISSRKSSFRFRPPPGSIASKETPFRSRSRRFPTTRRRMDCWELLSFPMA